MVWFTMMMALGVRLYAFCLVLVLDFESIGMYVDYLLERLPVTPRICLLDSLVLSISLFSISSILSSTNTGPNSSLSHQSLQIPFNPLAPVRLVVRGTPPCNFSHLACSSGCVFANSSSSRQSRLCFKISSWIAWATSGIASPVRPSSVQ